MKKVRFTEERMVEILQEADRLPVSEVAKRHGISDQTNSRHSVFIEAHHLPGSPARMASTQELQHRPPSRTQRLNGRHLT